MNTLYLNPTTWDLAVDVNGNIAMATDPYAPVQDAASAIKTFLGECYFNTGLGIPYFTQILGNGLPLELYRKQAISAALTVPEVVSANVFFTQLQNRSLVGQIQVTLESNVTTALNIGLPINTTFTLDSSTLDSTTQLGY